MPQHQQAFISNKEQTKFDLYVKHPDYDNTYDYRWRSRALYEGSARVKDRSIRQEFLFPEKNEDPDDYELRVNRAIIDPWIAKIVTARQALLFSKSHTRELDARIDQYFNDVDLHKTSAEEFFFNVAEQSQIDGVAWIKVNMTPRPVLLDNEGNPLTDENGNLIPLTGADDAEANHRPYFQVISGFDVWDWEFGADGRLDWATVYQPELIREPKDDVPWGWKPKVRDKWEVWTRDTWFIYGLSPTSKDSSPEFILEDAGSHPLREVPLVPFYGLKRGKNSGLPVSYSVLDHIILLYNKESDLDWFERLSAHPIPYTVGGKKPTRIDSGKGFHLMTTPDTPQGMVGYLETSGNGFESIRQSNNDIRFRVMSTMLSQAKKDSAQVQSADGQREDRKIFMTSLNSVAHTLEHSEMQCWILMYLWITEGARIDPSKEEKIANIVYNKDFDDTMIDDSMIKALSDLVTKNQLPLRQFIEKLIEGELLPVDTDIDQLIDDLEQDAIRQTGLMPENKGFTSTENEE